MAGNRPGALFANGNWRPDVVGFRRRGDGKAVSRPDRVTGDARNHLHSARTTDASPSDLGRDRFSAVRFLSGVGRNGRTADGVLGAGARLEYRENQKFPFYDVSGQYFSSVGVSVSGIWQSGN